ncbi:MAG: hypothetical protein OXB98_06850 [Bryobacterales bacterium]|nr:hypothetical protein [Bryobacterales bacterium]
MSAPAKIKSPSKHDEPIKIDASPEAVVHSLFNGRPKRKWRYLSKDQRIARGASRRRTAK